MDSYKLKLKYTGCLSYISLISRLTETYTDQIKAHNMFYLLNFSGICYFQRIQNIYFYHMVVLMAYNFRGYNCMAFKLIIQKRIFCPNAFLMTYS